MWAGGSFEWSANPDEAPRVGEVAEQRTSVASAQYKSDMIFINQQRDLSRVSDRSADKWAVREIRTHVFRRVVSGNAAVKAKTRECCVEAC
jgi:hypothetical protein